MREKGAILLFALICRERERSTCGEQRGLGTGMSLYEKTCRKVELAEITEHQQFSPTEDKTQTHQEWKIGWPKNIWGKWAFLTQHLKLTKLGKRIELPWMN